MESGGGVGEQLPDDDQDGAGDRDQGFEFAAAFDDAPVALAEEGVGFGGRGGVLDLGLALDEGLRQGAVHGLGQRTRSSPIRPRRRRPRGGRGAGL